MPTWPRPESLLPPRLVAALDAALAGDIARAAELRAGTDGRDPLAADVARLVDALVALQRSDASRARRDLRRLVARADPAIALAAAGTLVDDALARRRLASALPVLHGLRNARLDAAARLWIEALRLAVALQRRGTLPEGSLEALERRLHRRLPAAVHGAVHLLRAESALLAGDLAAAVVTQREARPHVRSSGLATLGRRLDVLSRQLRAPFADVEDWEEPLRTVTREELVDLEDRPWRLWVDALHRRVRHRRRSGGAVTTVELGAAPLDWQTLELVVHAAPHQVTWAQAVGALQVADAAAARERVENLRAALGAAADFISMSNTSYGLVTARAVIVLPPASLPPLELRLLGRLAVKPRAGAAALVDRDAARRTIVGHLARLRDAGYVRVVGAGNEQRYVLI